MVQFTFEVLAGKYQMKYNLRDKRFPNLNFRHPLESKGCPKFRLKDFFG